MESAPPVNEQRATGLSLNDGTGEGKARQRTGLEIQSTGCFGHGPNTAVLSWSAQPTESRDLVRDHRQSIPIPNANQSDPVTLQVRTLTSHGVAKPMLACENPQHADYVLGQTNKARPISADGSDSNGRYEADSDLNLQRSLLAEQRILGIECQPGQPGYFSDVMILQARPEFHRRAAEQISDLDSVSDLNPQRSLLAEWKHLGFDIERKPPGYWKQEILQALSDWNAVEQISGAAADFDSDSPGDCEPSVSLSDVGVSIQVDRKPPATSACCAQMVLQAQHDGNAAAQVSDAAAELVSVSDSDYSACMTEVGIQESQPVTDQCNGQCSAVQPCSDQGNGQCWDQSGDHCDGEYAEQISAADSDSDSDSDFDAEQMLEREAIWSEMQLQADSDRLQLEDDLSGSDLPGSDGGSDSGSDFDSWLSSLRSLQSAQFPAEAGAQFDPVLTAEADGCSGGCLSQETDSILGDGSADPGGSDSDSGSGFDFEAEQMLEREAIWSEMQLQADSDRLQLEDDLSGSDLPGSDLSGSPDSDVSVQSRCSNSDEEQDELRNDQFSDSDQLSDHDHNSGQFSDHFDDSDHSSDPFSDQDYLHLGQLSDQFDDESNDQLSDQDTEQTGDQNSDQSDDRFSDEDQFSDPEYDDQDYDDQEYDDELRSDSGGPDD